MYTARSRSGLPVARLIDTIPDMNKTAPIIPLYSDAEHAPAWRRALADAVTQPAELLALLGLPEEPAGAAAAQEFGHSKLFNTCYSELFNGKLGAEKFWLNFGLCQSYLIFALPVSLKLKLASLTELLAVKQFESDIASGAKNKYIDIVKRIIQDERDHADICNQW